MNVYELTWKELCLIVALARGWSLAFSYLPRNTKNKSRMKHPAFRSQVLVLRLVPELEYSQKAVMLYLASACRSISRAMVIPCIKVSTARETLRQADTRSGMTAGYQQKFLFRNKFLVCVS